MDTDPPRCALCNCIATHVELVPDAPLPGRHSDQRGPRLRPLCLTHYSQSLLVATRRMRAVPEDPR